jgi:DNA-binding IclR family transcriptional regulator
MKRPPKNDSGSGQDGGVRVVERVAQILEALSTSKPLSLKEIGETCGFAASTAFRLLDTMQRAGLVEREPVSKRYQLGRMLFRLVANSKPRKDIIAAAHPVLQALAGTTDEDALLAELHGMVAVFIDRVEGSHPLKIVDMIGRPEPLYYGAFRKCLLAYQDDEWIERYVKGITFRKLTRSTIASPSALWKEIARIRAQGYATSYGEWIPEAAGIAAPVFDYTGRIRAAIHLLGPLSRINPETASEYLPAILSAAEQVSVAIGAPKSPPGHQ